MNMLKRLQKEIHWFLPFNEQDNEEINNSKDLKNMIIKSILEQDGSLILRSHKETCDTQHLRPRQPSWNSTTIGSRTKVGILGDPHPGHDMCAWLKFELRHHKQIILPRVMFHLAFHRTLNTSTSSLSLTSPVLVSSTSPNPNLLSTHPFYPLWRSTTGWYLYGIPFLHSNDVVSLWQQIWQKKWMKKRPSTSPTSTSSPKTP